MPEGSRPAEEGRSEVEDGEGVDPREVLRAIEEAAGEVVVHHEPVRIPFSALPSRPLEPPGPSFATTFVIGTAASPWFAAALVSGGAVPVLFALGWLAVLAADLGLALRSSSRR